MGLVGGSAYICLLGFSRTTFRPLFLPPMFCYKTSSQSRIPEIFILEPPSKIGAQLHTFWPQTTQSSLFGTSGLTSILFILLQAD